MSAPNRRHSVTQQVGPFAVTVGFTQDHTGAWTVPFEVFITARGKSGTELDELLYEMGTTASAMMQGKG